MQCYIAVPAWIFKSMASQLQIQYGELAGLLFPLLISEFPEYSVQWAELFKPLQLTQAAGDYLFQHTPCLPSASQNQG
jgi:hypothetical protein